jgi:hypothetical protein
MNEERIGLLLLQTEHIRVHLWQSYVPILLQETCSFVTIVCSHFITRNVFICDNRMFPFYYKKHVHLWQSYVPILLQETCPFVTIVCSHSITRNVFICDNRMFPFYYKKCVHLWQSYVPILLQEMCSFVPIVCSHSISRRVWRCQRGNQDVNQRTTDNTMAKRKRTNNELRCSKRMSSSCSTSGTRRVNLGTNPVINHEWGKDREVFMTSGTYPWSLATQIFHNDQLQPCHGGARKTFEVITST